MGRNVPPRPHRIGGRDEVPAMSVNTDPVRRPVDDAVLRLQDSLAWQERYCARLDAPVSAGILAAIREDLEGERRLAGALPEQGRFGDLPGLRILAAVHRVAIDGGAPRIAAIAPTMRPAREPASGPVRDDHGFGDAVIAALESHPETVRDYLGRFPQTNEVGRSAPLRMALSRIRGPVALLEIGASAGLEPARRPPPR